MLLVRSSFSVNSMRVRTAWLTELVRVDLLINVRLPVRTSLSLDSDLPIYADEVLIAIPEHGLLHGEYQQKIAMIRCARCLKKKKPTGNKRSADISIVNKPIEGLL